MRAQPVDHHKSCQHGVYRLSCREFDELFAFANGRCQVCKTPEAETTRGCLVIDHDPAYDYVAVRGLLCDKCNSLMRRSDAGKHEPLAYPYLADAWFIRKLRAVRTA